MGKFMDVFRADLLVNAPDFKPSGNFPASGEWQRYVTEHFDDFVNGTNLHFWTCGAPIAKCEKRLLIGAATYSQMDMQLLDVLDDWLKKHESMGTRIDVFDLGICSQINDLDEFFPHVKNVYMTPHVGLWENGVFQEMITGYAARGFLSKHLDIPFQLLTFK
ncbi:MAG: hypothetical protein ACR2MB_04350 [Acidimicrobiales bacterium]